MRSASPARTRTLSVEAAAGRRAAARRTDALCRSCRCRRARRSVARAREPLRRTWLERRRADLELAVVCANAARRRTALEHRAAFLAATMLSEMPARSRAFAAGATQRCEGIADRRSPKLVFVFPGQGGQWVGHGARACRGRAGLPRGARACERRGRPLTWTGRWSNSSARSRVAPAIGWIRSTSSSPCCIALAIAYAEWLRVARRAARCRRRAQHGRGRRRLPRGALDLWTTRCGSSAAAARSCGSKSGQGAMALVDLSDDEAENRLVGPRSRVSVAVSNSPRPASFRASRPRSTRCCRAASARASSAGS